MSRAKLWMIGASVFTAVNLMGAGLAIADSQATHASIHAGLAFLGAVLWWFVSARERAAARAPAAAQQLAGERIDYLQQSVDAIAIELERIGEAQRYEAKLREQRGASEPPPQDKKPLE